MKALKSIGQFILTSQIFIALCALGLSIESSILLNSSFHNIHFYGFIFFATLGVYNFYYVTSSNFPHAKILFAIASLFALYFGFFLPKETYPILSIIGILSGAYLIPAKWWLLWSNYFHLQKLIILISIWVVFTFVFPLYRQPFNYTYCIYLLYRCILMSQLCILFLIKDESNLVIKKWSIQISSILSYFQLLISLLVLMHLEIFNGLIFLSISFLLLFISRKFNKRIPDNSYYLFFVDGIMLLETIFVLLKWFVIHEF